MQDRKTLLDGAHVGLEGLLTHMTKHFASLESTQCTLLETIAITGMNKKEITKACALGLIKPQCWRREFCFLGGDLSRLLSSHISIKRWSRISGVPTRRLLANLPASRFDASIEGVLYKRTEELGSWLDSFAAPPDNCCSLSGSAASSHLGLLRSQAAQTPPQQTLNNRQ